MPVGTYWYEAGAVMKKGESSCDESSSVHPDGTVIVVANVSGAGWDTVPPLGG